MDEELPDKKVTIESNGIKVEITANEGEKCQNIVWLIWCALSGFGYSDEIVKEYIDTGA